MINKQLTRRDFVKTVGVGLATIPFTGCGGGHGPSPIPPPQIVAWPISRQVYTTAQRQVQPVAIAPSTPHIAPAEVSEYARYGYSAWTLGGPLPYQLRKELAPGYTGAPRVARLLRFFSFSDVHIADKESPAQPIYVGLKAGYGSNMSSAYSPIILSTPQVLDAAVQTINALHKTTPFDFGLSLGDAANNTQFNELRWFLDTIDGKVITPSSGAHAGQFDIDYQQPFYAAGLNAEIPWYQVIGNHDQFWMGSYFENSKTRNAHIASTILNMGDNPASPDSVDESGFYMGVVDGSMPYGDIIGAGPEADFPTPPSVVADSYRHTLVTASSTTINWMKEFFHTTSQPAGHGFAHRNLASGSACYSFVPKSDIPIKIIVLDDTVKGPGQANYAAGGLDLERYNWLVSELDAGQASNQLMIVAAHVPVMPQTSLTDTTPYPMWPGPVYSDEDILHILFQYPNFILWMAGHRHVNVVTLQVAPSGQPSPGFWEVETCSLRDFPQQFRTFDIRRNADNTVSIIITNVDPAVQSGSPAYKSRGYAIGAARVYATYPLADTTSHAYNAEMVVHLTPVMQSVIAQAGTKL